MSAMGQQLGCCVCMALHSGFVQGSHAMLVLCTHISACSLQKLHQLCVTL